MSFKPNERAALIGQLVAMKNVLDGVLASLEESPSTECEHPEEQRKYAGEMGNARFTCGACGETVVVPSPEQIRDRIVRPATPQGA